jgi:hypothetical protein
LRVLDVPKDLLQDPAAAVQLAQQVDDNDLSIADLGGEERPIMEEQAEEDAAAAAAFAPRTKPAHGKEAGAPARAALAATARVKLVGAHVAGAKVPNFKGMSMREVLAEAAAQGLPLIANGSGMAKAQSPAPGTVLREGDRIRVRFTR